MKLLEPHTKQIGDNIFYIRPFPAFKAANLSGEIASIMLPLLTALSPLLGTSAAASGGILDADVETLAQPVTDAFSAISGDKLEMLLKHLLIAGKNISVETPDDKKAKLVTEDIINELFCEEVQDMFMLAFEVIKINYNGFFKKLAAQFGPVIEAVNKAAAS